MSTLISTWAPHFASDARTRGRALHMDRRVRQVPAANGDLVRAEVRDDQTYIVTIQGDGPTTSVNCTCDAFAAGRYCEHVWATLLDVQQRGVLTTRSDGLTTATSAGSLTHATPGPPKARKRTGEARASDQRTPAWMARLALVRSLGNEDRIDPRAMVAERREVCYVVNAEMSNKHQGLVIELRQRQAGRRGWGPMKRMSLSREAAANLKESIDRELCALLIGAAWVDEFGIASRYGEGRGHDVYRLAPGAARPILRRMIRTGRCYFHPGHGEQEPTRLTWGGDDAWKLWLVGKRDGDGLDITVELRRDEDRMRIAEPALILGGADGLVIYGKTAAPLEDADAFGWAGLFRDEIRLHGDAAPIHVASDEVDAFLDRLYRLGQLPPLDLPEDVDRVARALTPVPHLALSTPPASAPAQRHLTGRIWFVYDGVEVRPEQPGRFIVPNPQDDYDDDDDASRATELMQRDLPFEREAVGALGELGFRANPIDGPDALTLRASLLPDAVAELTRRGWSVTADQQALRSASAPELSVRSGIDWFELHGNVRYQTDSGEQFIGLPEILAAARAGKTMIALDDGSHGMLPQHWLAQHGLLTTVGQLEDDHLRFKSSQAALLDALLAQQDVVDIDERFREVREQLQQFDRIEAVHETVSFAGTLREYQRDGVGWLRFLRTFALGGILADDMGLGKTVQVLAMLVARYADQTNGDGAKHKPTLVVAPRSVVFNWLDEAARFAPTLRVGDYGGGGRQTMRERLSEYDLIVTSYGLMRRDITHLIEHEFDYVVLDEAQAIKNPGSQAAKASRLLRCDHRLALTGTPVENHLGDLWSIFEYLNPGMLGSATRFARFVRGAQKKRRRGAAAASEASTTAAPVAPAAPTSPAGAPLGKRSSATNLKIAEQAGRALRPFILRRTKTQVLSELPEKTEQTIVCRMPADQRRVYDELLQHYRSLLLKSATPTPAATGLGEQTMLVIEALLRLRQASCHPALIDPKRTDAPSAKLDTLLEQLTELIEEGHKALVFSQFTSMLALVKPRLDQAGIRYEYLDGQTRDRKSPVERFQNDPACPVFLISLKAGGLGLNLTAADYVFILDPWWNPAVEQQAIDRAHRIGQTRHVTAYRLICHDTVEQRIAELQDRKRELAEAIVGGQQENLLASLTREDLEMLLR